MSWFACKDCCHSQLPNNVLYVVDPFASERTRPVTQDSFPSVAMDSGLGWAGPPSRKRGVVLYDAGSPGSQLTTPKW
eukprot:1675314-Amphidinium_carterae.1